MVDQSVESLPYATQSVYHCLEQLWSDEKDWLQYVRAMHLALLLNTEPDPTSLFPFLHLPGLCCQAACGEPQHAISVAVAWVLLYTAAHLLDDVEDGEIVGQVVLVTVNVVTD